MTRTRRAYNRLSWDGRSDLMLIDRTETKQAAEAPADDSAWLEKLEDIIFDRLPSCFHLSYLRERFQSDNERVQRAIDNIHTSKRLESVGTDHYHVRW